MASVYVKVYIGENDGNPSFLKIKPIPDDIFDLRDEIKAKNSNVLRAIDAVQLKVYAAGTSYPIVEGQDSLDPGDAVPTDIAYEKPLIVVAPALVWVSVFVCHLR